jgi:hypothetical protein
MCGSVPGVLALSEENQVGIMSSLCPERFGNENAIIGSVAVFIFVQ